MNIKKFFLGLARVVLHFVLLMLVGALSTFVTLRFFTAGDEVVVPDLKGKDPVEAIQILNRAGLQLKILPQKRYSDEVPVEKILLQEPPANRKIKQGRSVEVYLSLGPQKVVVPDLTGQTTRVAYLTLEQNHLQPGKIIYVSNPNANSDQILAQYPLPGTEVTNVRTVNLLANTGVPGSSKVYIMPDVIGHSVSSVQGFFLSAGLHVATVQPVDYPGIASGTVVKQSPPAGYKLTGDTPISLYYSK